MDALFAKLVANNHREQIRVTENALDIAHHRGLTPSYPIALEAILCTAVDIQSGVPTGRRIVRCDPLISVDVALSHRGRFGTNRRFVGFRSEARSGGASQGRPVWRRRGAFEGCHPVLIRRTRSARK